MFHAFNKRELEYYDLFHQDKDYKQEAQDLPLVGKTILEIGSGTGLMTKELEKLGYNVTTVDPNVDADYDSLPTDIEWFDNILALYDVGNYIKPKQWAYIVENYSAEYTDNFICQVWERADGVKFFTHKKVGSARRVRIGFRLFNKAHLLYIYWGKGLALAYHKLYLH